ncbi:DUF6525 family protein [Rhizobium grahamii]|uniref:Uncharacterized protein n=1 Tax=Rhizobium grahamii CCGE 502 TaxID=990285 RepID=S3IL46_9HYPH|nr:DUF6525 family protein [Rhizobium grahamii]EPE99513.1 hypothetical protein RGCCGE502_05000 [Rhizobium grahamii CCGE 502]
MNILAPSTTHQRMQAFDSLPKPLRIAISGAAFPYDPREIAERIAKGRRPETILRGIVRCERRAQQ